MKYLDYFLIDNPNEFCAKGGHASFGDALNIVRAEDSHFTRAPTHRYKNHMVNYDDTDGEDYIQASYFMAYHRVCIKSYECQENLEAARYLGIICHF